MSIVFAYNEFEQDVDYDDAIVKDLLEVSERCDVVQVSLNGGVLDYPYGVIYGQPALAQYAAVIYMDDSETPPVILYSPLLLTINFTIKLWINARFLSAITKMQEEHVPPDQVLPVLTNILQHSLDTPIDCYPDLDDEADISDFIAAFRGDGQDEEPF